MYKKFNTIHLVGIGGIGMSAIAELLHRNGYTVRGSDIARAETVRRLESLGIAVAIGHGAANIAGADLVVYSSAISGSNPELAAAASNEVPVISRAEMLVELMRLKYGIAVAGAHGKTTTSSMIAAILAHAGLDPTVVVGGKVDCFGGTNTRAGNGEFMVVEADESDGSFTRLTPAIAVVTNIDREHLDHYDDMSALQDAFLKFINSVPFYGLSVVCGDDPHLRALSGQITRRSVTYGFSKECSYQIERYTPGPVSNQISVRYHDEVFQIHSKLPGKHNALNTLAAIAVADEISIPRAKTLEALASYTGVQRRFQLRGELDGVTLVDDYAHHPSEIRATLSAARERFPRARVHVAFQPHRYSRVHELFDQFSLCFAECDDLVVTKIYGAGETHIEGVTGQAIVEAVIKSGHRSACYVPDKSDAIACLRGKASAGDVILTLGAGDLPNVYREIL